MRHHENCRPLALIGALLRAVLAVLIILSCSHDYIRPAGPLFKLVPLTTGVDYRHLVRVLMRYLCRRGTGNAKVTARRSASKLGFRPSTPHCVFVPELNDLPVATVSTRRRQRRTPGTCRRDGPVRSGTVRYNLNSQGELQVESDSVSGLGVRVGD